MSSTRQASRDRYRKQVSDLEKRTLENEKMLIQAKLNYNKEKKRIENLERLFGQFHTDNFKTKKYIDD